MSIRPNFYILVGIDDVEKNDNRFSKKLSEEELEDILWLRQLTEEECWKSEDGFFNDYLDYQHKYPDTSLNLSDKLYNPRSNDDMKIKNIVGFVVYKDFDSEIIRAFCTFDKKYLSSGYERIPTLNPEEHQHMIRYYDYTNKDIECNRFVDGVFESMPTCQE